MINNLKDIPIGKDINNIACVSEFTNEDYKEFRLAGIKPVFENEKFYFQDYPTSFGNHIWTERAIFGVIDNTVYKMSVQTDLVDKIKCDEVFNRIKNHVVQATVSSPIIENENKISWNFNDGNILLHRINHFGMNLINLTVTSSLIRDKYTPKVTKSIFLNYIQSLALSKIILSLFKKT